MPIVDLYSARKQAAEKTQDVWVYDQIPNRLRVQVSDIVRGALGPIRDYAASSGEFYTYIRDTIAHEHGRGCA